MEGGYDANDIYTLIDEYNDTHDQRIMDVIRQLWRDSDDLFVARDEDGVTPFQYAIGLDHEIAYFIFELVKSTFPDNPRLVAQKLLLDNVDDIGTTALLTALEDLPMAEKIMELGIAIGDPSEIAWEHEDELGGTASEFISYLSDGATVEYIKRLAMQLDRMAGEMEGNVPISPLPLTPEPEVVQVEDPNERFVPVNATIYDLVSLEDISVQDYLAQDASNLIIKYGDNYISTTIEQLRLTSQETMMDVSVYANSTDMQRGIASKFYPCGRGDNFLSSVIRANPLYNTNKISQYAVLIKYEDVDAVVKNPTTASRVLYLTPTSESVVATASANLIDYGHSLVSATHCAPGSGGVVYRLKAGLMVIAQ